MECPFQFLKAEHDIWRVMRFRDVFILLLKEQIEYFKDSSRRGSFLKAKFGERSTSDLKIMSCERNHNCEQ